MKMILQQQQDPGGDKAVLRIHLAWVASVPEVLVPNSGPPICHVYRQPSGLWELAMAFDREPGRRQRHFVVVDPFAMRTDRWRLLRLGPGVWDVPVSIHVPEQMHAFVTLVNVPEPPPWVVTNSDQP